MPPLNLLVFQPQQGLCEIHLGSRYGHPRGIRWDQGKWNPAQMGLHPPVSRGADLGRDCLAETVRF